MVRGPAPLRGDDPAARVAAIILNLEESLMPPPTHRGSTVNGSAPVQELVAEGDAAVEPLLAAIETDTRMTRSVSYGRGPTIYHHVHPALEPEFSALTMIYKTEQFSGQEYQVEFGKLSRRELAQSMREYWTKNRALPMPERWYRTLQDDAGGYRPLVGGRRQHRPAQRSGRFTHPGCCFARAIEPIAAAMKGEELRSRRDPSISELLARRVLQLARDPRQPTNRDPELERAGDLVFLLDRWDPKAALPVIRALLNQARMSVDRSRSQSYGGNYGLMVHVARFTLIRAGRASQRPSPTMRPRFARATRIKTNPTPSMPSSRCGPTPMTRRSARPRAGSSTTRARRGRPFSTCWAATGGILHQHEPLRLPPPDVGRVSRSRARRVGHQVRVGDGPAHPADRGPL